MTRNDPEIIEAVRVAYVDRGLAILDTSFEVGVDASIVRLIVADHGWTRRAVRRGPRTTLGGPYAGAPGPRSSIPTVPRSQGAHRRRRTF